MIFVFALDLLAQALSELREELAALEALVLRRSGHEAELGTVAIF